MSDIHVDPPAGETPGGEPSSRRLVPRARVWVPALLAGLMAGFIAWLIGEAIHARFAPATLVNIAGTSGGFVGADEVHSLDMAKRVAQILDATLVFGAFGVILGLALGLAGGSARGPGRSALRGAIVGSILGGTVAAVMTPVLLLIYYAFFNPDTNELIVGLLFQVAISAAVGAAGGSAFGLGLGTRDIAVRAAVGGLLGAATGALVYQMAGAVAFPLAETSSPISATWGTRLLARVAVATLAAVGVAMGVLDRGKEAIASPGVVEQVP